MSRLLSLRHAPIALWRGLPPRRRRPAFAIALALLGLAGGQAAAQLSEDFDAPTSAATAPAFSRTTPIAVDYTAADPSGIAKVELWVKAPGGDRAHKLDVDVTPDTPSFRYEPGSGEGRYEFFTRAWDAAGNYEDAPASADATTTFDTTKPLQTTHDVPASWQKTDVTVTLTGNDGGSGIDKTYYTIGAPTIATAWKVYDPAAKPTLADGETISFYSTDKAGNAEDPVQTSPAAKVDEHRPATSDDVPTGWQKDAVTVTLSASDTGGSGVAKTYYTTGATPADPTTAGAVYDPANKPTLAHGEAIKYFSTDEAGNAEAVKTSAAAQVDTQAPSTSDDVPSGWQKSDVVVTLTADDAGAGVEKTYYTTGAVPSDPSLSTNLERKLYTPDLKPQLAHGEKISYYSVDALGHAEPVRTSVNAAKVDKEKPSTTHDVPSGWQKSDVVVTLNAGDTGGAGVEKTYYTTGANPSDASDAANTERKVYEAASKPALGHGEKISFFSTDTAGNAEAVKTSPAAQVDKQLPTTSDDVPTDWRTSAVTVTLSAADQGGSGLVKTYYTTGASPADPTTASAQYDALQKPKLGDGEKIKYFSTDGAGNAEAVKTSAAARVDSDAPVTTDDVPVEWRKTDVTVTLSASDTGGSGVKETYYTTGVLPADPTIAADRKLYDPANKPTLAHGEKISYYSIDDAGHREGVRTSVNAAKVDKDAPATSDDVPSGWQKSDVAVTLSVSDSGGSDVAKTYYTTGTSPADPTTASAVYDSANKPKLGHGESIKYFSTDGAGNAEAVKTSPAVQVDTVPPATTDDVPADVQTSDVTVTLTATDADSGVKETWYTTGATPSDPSDASNPARKPYTADLKPKLADGEKISYYSIDTVGNAEGFKTSAAAQVDGKTPASKASSAAYTSLRRMTVTYVASDPDQNGVTQVTLYAKAPGELTYSAVATDSSPDPSTSGSFTGSLEYSAPTTAPDGDYDFYTRAKDALGNEEAAPSRADTTTRLDTEAPTSQASAPTTSRSTTVSVGYSASVSDGSPLERVELWMKAPGATGYRKVAVASTAASSGSFDYTVAAGDGDYGFYTRAMDKADNYEDAPVNGAADGTTKVDTKAPSTTADVAGGWQKNDVVVTLTGTDDGGSGVKETYYTTGASPSDPSDASNAQRKLYDAASKPALGHGEKIRFFSTDNAGNAEPVQTSAAAQVDKQAPSTSDSVPSGWQKADVTVTLAGSDEGGSGVKETYFTTGATPSDPSDASNAQRKRYDPANKPTLGHGEKISYASTDNAGNTEVVKTSAAAQVDKVAPRAAVATPSDGQEFAQHEDVASEFTCDDGSGSGIESCTGPAKVDTSKLGAQELSVTAKDRAGHTATKTVAYTVVDRTNPTITISGPAEGQEFAQGQDVASQFTCDDGDGSGIETCSGPAKVDTSELGPHAFSVAAKDKAGNTATKRVSYTVVDRTDPTIEITTPSEGQVFAQGEDVGSKFSCDDGRGAGIQSCAGPAKVDTTTLGDRPFTVTATDKAGNTTSKTVSYRVRAETVKPTITIAAPSEGQTFTQGDDVASRFSCEDGPGSGIESCDGPAKVETTRVGEHRFRVTARDKAGNTASKTVTYKVVPRPEDPAPPVQDPTPPVQDPTPPTPDTTPPAASLVTSRASTDLRRVVTRGVPVSVRCTEACGITVELRLYRATARSLRLPGVIGHASARAAAVGTKRLAVKLTPGARKRLRGMRRVSMQLRLHVVDAAGNRRTVKRKLVLVRR
jgi:hypothetical protein